MNNCPKTYKKLNLIIFSKWHLTFLFSLAVLSIIDFLFKILFNFPFSLFENIFTSLVGGTILFLIVKNKSRKELEKLKIEEEVKLDD